MGAVVTGLALAPVKGLRLQAADAVELEHRGVVGDRAFVVVEADGTTMVQSTRTPALQAVSASSEPGGGLRLRLPDGAEVSAEPAPGAASTTRGYDGRPLAGRLVDGPLADALSGHLGRRVRLLRCDPGAMGADDHPVTLMSQGSLAALGAALGGPAPDPRRFRMSITIDGVAPWEEHGWGAHELRAGSVVLRGVAPVPRCVVTTRHPDTGARDVPVLKALAQLRGKRDVTFGLWCDVVHGGRLRVGDRLDVRPA